MRKIAILIVAVLMMVASAAWGTVVFFPKAASSSCSSGSDDATQLLYDQTWSNVYNNVIFGEGFKVSTTKKLYSIVVRVAGSDLGTAPTADIRVGTSENLTSYIVEVTNVDMSTTGEVEIIFPSHPTLTAGAQYYFGLLNAGTDWGTDRFDFNYQDTDAYSDGQMYVSGSGNGWDMTGQGVSGWDLYFRIKLCQ